MAPIAELGSLPTFEQLGYHETPPPFVNGLLKEQSVFRFSQNDFSHLINHVDTYTPKFLAVQMDRQVDTTGLVSNFIGRCSSPEEVQAELDAIARTVLMNLSQEPKSLQEQVADLLRVKHDDTTSVHHEGFLWIDRQYEAVMATLKIHRTPEAEMYRQRTLETIKTHPATDIMYIPTYSIPALSKYWYDTNCHVIHINRYTHIPKLPEENRRLLDQLTPRVFKRQEHIPDLDPMSQFGLMQQLGKLGDPLARVLAETLEEQGNLQKFADKYIFNSP